MKPIEKLIYPVDGELICNEGTYQSTIVDAELDPSDVSFHYDGCVKIETEEYTHLTLSVDNLQKMIELIKTTEKLYKNQQI